MYGKYLYIWGVSLIAQSVNNLPAIQETQIQYLGQEDTLEKEMETHSNILAWRIPWTEELGGLQSMGSQRVKHDWATNMSLFCFSINTLFKIPYSNVLGLAGGSVVKNLPAMQETWVLPLGQEWSPEEGNGNPLQYSYLGNPMDRGASQTIVHGFAKESNTT